MFYLFLHPQYSVWCLSSNRWINEWMKERYPISIALYPQRNLFFCTSLLFCFSVFASISEEFLKFDFQVHTGLTLIAALSLLGFLDGLSFDETHPWRLLFLDIDQVFSLQTCHIQQFVKNFWNTHSLLLPVRQYRKWPFPFHRPENWDSGEGGPSGSK